MTMVNSGLKGLTQLVRQQNAQYWPHPKSSDIVFSMLIIYLWGLHKNIQGGVEVSLLSNFNYSRWPPWTRKRFEHVENASVMMDSTL